MIYFLLFSFALRVIGFNTSAIWYDEAITLFRATHPLTYFNLWELSVRPFAYGPLWWLRLPSLIYAMAALWLAWLIMDELKFDKGQRVIACVFLSAFPGLIWMSQDARYYALITLATTATIYLALKHYWTFGVVFGLLYFVHPTAPAFGLAAYVIAWTTRMDIRKYILAVCAAPIIYFALNIFIRTIKSVPYTSGMCCIAPQTWFLGPIDFPYSAYSLVQAYFVNTLPAIIMLPAFGWLAWILIRACMRPLEIPSLLIIIPFSAVLIVSILYENVFYYRPLMALTFPLSLWIGFKRDRFITGVGIVLLMIGLANYNPATRGAYLDKTATAIRDEWQSGDHITYSNGLASEPFEYYLDDLPSCTISDEYVSRYRVLNPCTSEGDGREWLITSTPADAPPNAILFDHLWPWQVEPIYVYLVEK